MRFAALAILLSAPFGERRWVRVEGVYGYSTFSPSSGVRLTVGIAR